MTDLRRYAGYALAAIGLMLTVAAGNPSFATGSLQLGLLAVGLTLLLGGGIWVDLQQRSDDRSVASTLISIVGVLLFMAITFETILPRRLRIGLGFVGAVVLVASGIWHTHLREMAELDERRVRIRYRSTYYGFWTVNVLLLFSAFAAYAMGISVAFVLVVPPAVAGLLVVQFSEGWHERRM